MLVIGCGPGLNAGPVNAVAVANVPAARSGAASGLVNTARMIGATLGIAVLGAVFAMFAGGIGEGSPIVAGLAPAYVGGGIGEMIGAAATSWPHAHREATARGGARADQPDRSRTPDPQLATVLG